MREEGVQRHVLLRNQKEVAALAHMVRHFAGGFARHHQGRLVHAGRHGVAELRHKGGEVRIGRPDRAYVFGRAGARLIAEAPGLTFFLGANDYSLRKGVEYIGMENLHRGDVVLLNYPYWNAAHAYDATLFMPVFQPDETDAALVGYLCVRAHWMYLGAKDPGQLRDGS